MTLGRVTDALGVASDPTLVPGTERAGACSAPSRTRTKYAPRPAENEIDRLYRSLGEVTPENHPRTAKLLAASRRKVAQKVFEEAGEVALEAVRHNAGGIVRESADLLYNLVALWHRTGVRPDDVWAEMQSRALKLGIAEKLPKERDSLRDARQPAGGGDE
jgi:phosphoribosyl-ATP pyrophosphohydrolase